MYRITVKGMLDPSWSEQLAGLEVLPEEEPDSPGGKTSLLGRIRDEAELSGVLNTLCDLRLPLLRVEALEEENQQPKTEQELKK